MKKKKNNPPNRLKNSKLSEKEVDMLWGESGPYSEAKIVIESRILDDSVSRVMIGVRGNINPTTFKIVKENLDAFEKDQIVLDLVKSAVYRGKEYGYEIAGMPFEYDKDDRELIAYIDMQLAHIEAAIIRMHKFVMDYIGISPYF